MARLTYYSLTDPNLRESYLQFGKPGGSMPKIIYIAIALPQKVVTEEFLSNVLLFGYVTIFGIIVPVGIGLWWIRPQKTTEGIYGSTAHKFFAAAIHKKKLRYSEIITLLSQCQETIEVVQSYRKLDTEKLVQLYLALPNKPVHHMSNFNNSVISSSSLC